MKVCQLTGKRARVGNNVSHANNKTKRLFAPNLQKKRFFSEEKGMWITLKVASSAIRSINRKGFDAVVKEYALKAKIKANANKANAK
jgi:large subunit ribosomal protein L28